MEKGIKINTLEKEITVLKRKLDSLIELGSMTSDKVLELSRELDELIVGYYNLKNKYSM